MDNTTEKSPPVRTCKIDQVLYPSLLGMVQVHPTNVTIRTMVLAQIKQPLPDEAQSFEQIQEWIETHIKPLPQPMPMSDPPAPMPEPDAIGVEIEQTYIENGRCRYSVTRRGSGHYGMSTGDLRDLVQLARVDGVTFDQTAERVRQWFLDEAYDNPPDTDPDWETEDTDSHECDDDADSGSRILDHGVVRERLRDWMRINAPGALEELTDNEG